MAKQSYKIPESLDKSMGDNEIALKSKDGMGIKPMPLKLLCAYGISFFTCLFLMFNTFIKDAHFLIIILFAILWLCLTFVLFKRDKTDVPNYQLVATILEYLPKRMRYLITRMSARANPFNALVGIRTIHNDTGLIEFNDGTFGFAYRVVGTGSVLLFDDDKEAILNRVDNFWRKIQQDCEFIFFTTKESQKVHKQIDNMDVRRDNLQFKSPELLSLLNTEQKQLSDYVGGTFRSVHQYLVLKADNKEALWVAKNVLMSECENSSLMFKNCAAMFGEDIVSMLKTLYKGEESV